MQVEHVAGKRLASGRAAQQERHLPVGRRLLGEIVVNDKRMHAVVAEILAHRAAGVGRQELQRRRLGRRRRDHGRVAHGPRVLQGLDYLRDGRPFLAHRDVDAIELARLVATLVDRLLVDDGVDGDRRLSGLAVADDELALPAPDGDQAVESLQAGLHRFVDRLARNDARRLHLDATAFGGLRRTLAVDRIAQPVDHAAQQVLPYRNVDDGLGALDRIAFADGAVLAEDDDAHVVVLEIEGHSLNAPGEFDHLAGLDPVETVNARYPVADGQDLPHLGDLGLGAEVLDLRPQDRRNLGGANIHLSTSFLAVRQPASFMAVRIP